MRKKKKILLAIFALILIATAAIYIGTSTGLKQISLNPSYYEIATAKAVDGEAPKMSEEDTKKISETLSGGYKPKKARLNITGEYMYTVSPVYLGLDDAADIDDYAVSSTVGEGPNGEVAIFGESILIIDKRTVAIWDAVSEN